MTLNRFGNSSLGSVEKRPRKLNILLQRESFMKKLKKKKLGFKDKFASSTNYLLCKSRKKRGNNH